MNHRAVARAGLLVGVAAAAVGVAVHLGHAPSAQHTVASGSHAVPVSAGEARPVGHRRDAQRTLAAASRPTVRSAAARRMVRVDESQPHVDVFDPQTGGTIAMAEAKGLVKGADKLSRMHADPMPAGVKVSDPTDTQHLMARADLDETSAADQAQPFAAGASAPVGTPGIRSLRKHVVPSCSGTGTDGDRVQVLYVHEAGRSRFDSVLPILRNEVANVDDVFALSAEATGGERRVRWVHDSRCLPVIRSVAVPKSALGSDFWATVKAVQKLGFTSAHRKYLMFADANKMCGIGSMYGDTRLRNNNNNGYAASYSRVDANCWSSGHSVAAHELTHNLGGVQRTAPHATTNGHCFDESDIMCYDDGSGIRMKKVCPNAQEQLLDCHHDDYFNTHPKAGSYLARSWNTASSSFLDDVVGVPPTATVVAASDTAETGDRVALTATSNKPVSWGWSATKGCRVSAQSSGHATLLCPSTATGPVAVTATATEPGGGSKGSGTATVTLTQAAAPTTGVSAPQVATAGEPFDVAATATGKGPLGYHWQAAPCTVAASTAATTTVSCPATTPTQVVPVTVTVTQADGQRVQQTAGVALVGTSLPSDGTGGTDSPAPATGAGAAVPPTTPATPARTSFSAAQLRNGVLSATLRSGSSAVAARPVTVQVRWVGATTWSDAETLTTSAAGRVSTRVSRTRAGWFRFATVADDSYGAAVSHPVFVKVPTRLSGSRSHHRLVAVLTAGGGSRVGHARVLLQRKVHGHWRTVGRAHTNRRGRISHYVRSRHPAAYRWVFRGSNRLLSSGSRAVRIR